MTGWEEGSGLDLWGRPTRPATFTRAEAEAWLAAGHRLTAEQHELLLTQQGKLWSPGGAHDDI